MKGKKGFQKGEKANPNGRGAGTPNKLTKTVKESFSEVFNAIKDDPKFGLLNFAKTNTKDFYMLSTKLIPTEIEGTLKTTEIKVIRE